MKEIKIADITVPIAVKIPAAVNWNNTVTNEVPADGAWKESRLRMKIDARTVRRKGPFGNARIDDLTIDEPDVQFVPVQLEAMRMRNIWRNIDEYDREAIVPIELCLVSCDEERVSDGTEGSECECGRRPPRNLAAITIGFDAPLRKKVLDPIKLVQGSNVRISITTRRHEAFFGLKFFEKPTRMQRSNWCTETASFPSLVFRKGVSFE